jgi:hypothetical protein
VSSHSDDSCRSRSKLTAKDFAECWVTFSSCYALSPSTESFLSPKQELETLLKSASMRGATWTKQVQLCFIRSIMQQWRSKTSFLLEILVGAVCGMLIGLALYELRGRLFQGVYLRPFHLLSSAVSYMLVPEVGLLCCMAIGRSLHKAAVS